MAEPGWTDESPGPVGGGPTDETADRTAMIAGRLKEIYKRSVFPVEKKYQYDYFYESPLMTDVEFDGESLFWVLLMNWLAIYTSISAILDL
jgi:hypothetical protein